MAQRAELTSILVVLAALDPATMIPIGTVTGMLVAVFILFIRDSARNDERADVTYMRLVEGAEAERDRIRADLERVQANLHKREEEWARERTRLSIRIASLERLLFQHGIDPGGDSW